MDDRRKGFSDDSYRVLITYSRFNSFEPIADGVSSISSYSLPQGSLDANDTKDSWQPVDRVLSFNGE